MAVETTDLVAARKDAEDAAAKAKCDAANSAKTGVGTRLHFGRTRGKGSSLVFWEAFDESKPETLPKDSVEFQNVTNVTDPVKLLNYLIEGYNAEQYEAASDPIAEYIVPTWDTDKVKQFRIVVRNYSNMLKKTIDQAATEIRANMGEPIA